jgi:hypothetical protein
VLLLLPAPSPLVEALLLLFSLAATTDEVGTVCLLSGRGV